MVFTVILKVKDLFDGKILPDMGVEDKGVKFYNVVFRSENRDLIKLAFDKNDDSVEGTFVEKEEEVSKSLLNDSMKATYAKLDQYDPEIHVYLYKVYVDKDIARGTTLVGYTRRIGPHSEQDIPVLYIDVMNPTKIDGDAKKAFLVRVLQEKQKRYEPIGVLHTSNVNPLSPRWYTQKPFYGQSHVTGSNELQFFDYKDIIKNFYHPHECDSFSSIKELLKTFAIILHRGIVYKSDYKFNAPNSVDDYGDASIEMSTWGDCEDVAHFYMRTIRILCNTFKYNCDVESSMYKYCSKLKKYYTPMVMICRIEVHGQLEYHSTLMLIPTKESGLKPISLEVTAPEKTYDLGIESDLKEYNDWHVQHYFFVDSQHVCRIDKNVEEYTLDLFKDQCFNY